jgi:hypothetical protein
MNSRAYAYCKSRFENEQVSVQVRGCAASQSSDGLIGVALSVALRSSEPTTGTIARRCYKLKPILVTRFRPPVCRPLNDVRNQRRRVAPLGYRLSMQIISFGVIGVITPTKHYVAQRQLEVQGSNAVVIGPEININMCLLAATQCNGVPQLSSRVFTSAPWSIKQ